MGINLKSRYAIITPVKNEVVHIRATIQSVIAQTILPVEWLILNDGSTDGTEGIVQEYVIQYSWIRSININDVFIDEMGARIAHLLMYGVTNLIQDYDYILKLDADVSFDPQFCEQILNEFNRNDKLGIASGHLVYKGIIENIKFSDHTRGATKFFKKECWNDIGGVYYTTGWDTICDISARTKGWNTQTLDYYFSHHKEEGIKKGTVKRHYWNGIYCGRVPYQPIYFIFRLISHIFDRPLILSTFAEIWGYLKSRFILKDKPFPLEVTRYYRNLQLKRLKQRLTGRTE